MTSKPSITFLVQYRQNIKQGYIVIKRETVENLLYMSYVFCMTYIAIVYIIFDIYNIYDISRVLKRVY